MKIFIINSVPYGSTGRIMFQIADTVERQGGIAYTSASYTKPRGLSLPKKHYQIGTMLSKALHIALAKLTGLHGYYSWLATYRLVNKIKKTKPDIIHLHNIHGWYLNWPMLFGYLKQCGIPVVWTLHDCWAFTGHCPHFMAIGCDKWKICCFDCPLYKEYPGCFFDDSKNQYTLKKQCFTCIPDLTVVTPSKWLADLVKQSYLKEYNTVVINNGVDTSKFKPTPSKFREKYHLEHQIIVLGVAFDWSPRKGIDDFVKLAKELSEEYTIVLVGISATVKQKLPKNIITIECTQNQEELAEIYTVADLFVNPTREDNFPTVNLEALACGTPVITYQTGGSPESITDKCGKVVPYGDYEALKQAVIELKDAKHYMGEQCIHRAKGYRKEDKYKEYIDLYNKIVEGENHNEKLLS